MVDDREDVLALETRDGLGNVGFFAQKLGRVLLPGVVFSMRYPDDAGYVWNTIAQGKDEAALHLTADANCFIAYPRLSRNATYLPKNVKPVHLDCYDMSAGGKQALAKFIVEHRVRVIVFMSALPSTLDLAFLRKLGVKTLNTENDSFDHNQRDNFARKSIKFFVRRILKRQVHDLHLANARSQQIFLSRYALIPPSKLRLLTDGIDCDRFLPGDKAAARLKTGMSGDTFWVICVAQTRPEKRLDFIIRAAKQVAIARPNAKVSFMYVGDSDGDLLFELKRLANDLGLQKHFNFAGRQNDLVSYYQSADIMIHAAERESFGLSIVEGMACGLPVVASAAAGPKETILDGRTGALVEIDDFDEFVKQILYYFDNQAKAKEHGKNAALHAASHYSLDRYGKELAQYVRPFLLSTDR